MSNARIQEITLRCLLAVACLGVLMLIFSPSWGAFRLWSRVPELQGLVELRRGVSVMEQVAAPGAPISDPLHQVIQWRLLFPALGHFLHLPPPVFFALPHVGCGLVLFYIIALLRRSPRPDDGNRPTHLAHGSADDEAAKAGAGLPARAAHVRPAWLDCGLSAVALGASSWLFTSTGWLGYFDSWLALALLLVAFANSRWTVWIACLCGPWIDERFIIAVPLALLCRYLWRVSFETADTGTAAEKRSANAVATNGPDLMVAARASRAEVWRQEWLVSAILVVVFIVVRLGVLAGQSGTGATLAGYFADREFFDAPVWLVLFGTWEGLRAGWFFVGTAVALVFAAGRGRSGAPRWTGWLLLAMAFAVIVTGLATAQDFSRSMTMVFPAAVLGVRLAAVNGATWLPGALRIGAVVALMLPAHHVMSDRIQPIYYLHHEIAVLQNPPRAAMPEIYELGAIHAMQRGDYERAFTDLTLAIKLADNPASPAKQRGVLLASQGRWSEALQDFELMVTHDPENWDAWFMRAQAQLATGKSPAARADLDRAFALAPEGWAQRPEVGRFIAKLQQAP